jgi:hypothetical protein
MAVVGALEKLEVPFSIAGSFASNARRPTRIWSPTSKHSTSIHLSRRCPAGSTLRRTRSAKP